MTHNDYDSRHDTRWGGACPGTNIVQCTDAPDTAFHTWRNDQGTTQRVYFIVDAFGDDAGMFTIYWTPTDLMGRYGCSYSYSYGTTTEGAHATTTVLAQ